MPEPTSADELTKRVIREAERHLFEEAVPRIRRCVSLLDERQLWYRPNEASNSVANLILHIAGNTRQWAVAALGGSVDTRQRQREFDERGPIPADELLAGLDQVMEEVARVFETVTPAGLLATYPVQCFEETGVGIVMHVVEHTSYHVGQIAWITKMLTGEDLGFYDGLDLNQPNEPPRG